jgi:hypothetical protein
MFIAARLNIPRLARLMRQKYFEGPLLVEVNKNADIKD